jgi:hypothetical protein
VSSARTRRVRDVRPRRRVAGPRPRHAPRRDGTTAFARVAVTRRRPWLPPAPPSGTSRRRCGAP